MLDIANEPADTRRFPKASLVLGFAVAWTLACGGMAPEMPGSIPTDLDEPAAERGDAVVPEPEPEPEPAAPQAPETLFAKLEVDEQPLTRAPTCPKGTSVIRHPRGRVIEVYCATHAGKKQGVWTQWRGRTLLATRTYELGVQEGVAMTWSKEEQGPRKRSQSTWKAGDQHGAHAEWSAEGTLLVRGGYHEGKRQGRFLERDGTQDPPTFAGTCYEAGEANWHTNDPVAFVTDPCGEPAKL